jgi:single-stranded DNA-binding protein
VVGHITEREYTDKNGNERKAMEIRVNDVMLQGRKQDAAPKPVKEEKADYDDSEIPF